jgi:multicomponent Na+:H+ antiporter subunit A
MNISFYFLLGSLLSILLGWRPLKLFQIILASYWLVLFAWSLQLIEPFTFEPVTWSHFFNINLNYHIDGLARLFASLISGIGILIFIYAAIYTQGYSEKKAKLLSILQVFAIAMLSIVITDDLIVLFLSWELTTITSYLLIQFDVTDKKANQAAFNGMFISVLGGLSMLVGFILLEQQAGTWSIQSILNLLLHSSILAPAFWLLLLGAVTKSAQFPFYFWLPGAMKAPTPVSAYLHSATMVNAGIYLLARFHPLFIDLPYWHYSLTAFGMSTMLLGSILSLFQRDLKAILAYTTLFVLGSMVYLLASNQWQAAEAFAILLLFHACYKAAAFMWVGIIDKNYGSRDIILLRGLGRSWPAASLIAMISLSAMAGLPPLFGFVVKEMIYEAKLVGNSVSLIMMGLSVFSSMLIAAASFKFLYYWFTGQPSVNRQKKLVWGLFCPMVLVIVILSLNFLRPVLSSLLSAAATSIIPRHIQSESLYSGLSTLLSIITVLGGGVCFLASQWLNQKNIHWPAYLNPLVLFEQGLKAILALGQWFTEITQEQPLSKQFMIMFIGLLSVMIYILLPVLHQLSNLHWQHTNVSTYILSILMILCGITFLFSKRFLINMISFAVLGLLISGFFVLQGAPDVAMTQLLVEILTVIILVIALRKATFKPIHLGHWPRVWHAIVAILIGGSVTLLLFMVVNAPLPNKISQFFIQNSLPLGHGRNVVNVILVDFRAFDTLGEALVILATAVAIWLLTQQRHVSHSPTGESM